MHSNAFCIGFASAHLHPDGDAVMQADAIVHLPNLPHVKRYALDEHNLILRSEMNTASFDDLWGECSLFR